MNLWLKKRCDLVYRLEGILFLDLLQIEIQKHLLRKKESVSSVENMKYIRKQQLILTL